MLDNPLKMAKLLRRRLAGEPFPYSFIREADPYSAAPEDLVHGTDLGEGQGMAWFCCPPKFHESAGGKSPSKRKRKVAAAGEPYWHAEAGKKPILGEPMGAYKRALSYVKNVKNPPGMPTTFTRKRLGWCMLEIGLHGADQQLVLCKLYKSPRPPTDPETSREASVPGGSMPLPEPGPEPLVAEFPISRVAIVRNGSSAAAAEAALVTVVIDLSGTSVPPAAQRLEYMANLVRGMKSPVVVLSGMGNTTARILLAAWKALRCGAGKVCEIEEFLYVKEVHLRAVQELGLETSSVSGSLDELEHQLQRIAMTKELTPCTQDDLVSFGERTSTKMFFKYLNKLEGTLQVWKLRAIATSGRGSSDLTATTIDRALESREIQVWKDVDGILSCDPKVSADATLVAHLTFDEAAEFSDLVEQSTLTSIVLKSNITMLDIKSKRMLGQINFLPTALSKFQHFEYLGISVDCKVTTEGKMSLTLVPSALLSPELIKMELDNVVEELQKIADVHQLENVSVISLIGNAQKSSSIQEKALNVLRSINAEVHKFSQESSKVVMKAFLVVEKSRAKDCVQALHSAFFDKSLVPEVGGAEKAPPCVGLEWQETYSSFSEYIDGPLLSDGDPYEFPTNFTGDDDDLMPVGFDDNGGILDSVWAADGLDVGNHGGGFPCSGPVTRVCGMRPAYRARALRPVDRMDEHPVYGTPGQGKKSAPRRGQRSKAWAWLFCCPTRSLLRFCCLSPPGYPV